MSNRHGTSMDRHSLVRHGYETGGQLMDTRRTCTRCKNKRPQKGGRTFRGSNFVCAVCIAKEPGSIPK